MEDLDEVIEHLRKNVESAEKNGEDMDFVSWGYEAGILLSYNDARLILEALEDAKTTESWY